jgi:hypothetical protein
MSTVIHRVPRVLRRLLDACAAAEHDQVGKRDFLAVGRRTVELASDALERVQHFRELPRLVDRPILLRFETKARTVRTAALVGATEGGRRRPRGGNELRDRQARGEDRGFEGGYGLLVDQRVSDRGDRILPDELFGGDLRTEVARSRAHVAVRQLEPRAREGVRELSRMLHEAP